MYAYVVYYSSPSKMIGQLRFGRLIWSTYSMQVMSLAGQTHWWMMVNASSMSTLSNFSGNKTLSYTSNKSSFWTNYIASKVSIARVLQNGGRTCRKGEHINQAFGASQFVTSCRIQIHQIRPRTSRHELFPSDEQGRVGLGIFLWVSSGWCLIKHIVCFMFR